MKKVYGKVLKDPAKIIYDRDNKTLLLLDKDGVVYGLEKREGYFDDKVYVGGGLCLTAILQVLEILGFKFELTKYKYPIQMFERKK